jgi:hypothetical protein
VFDSHVGAQRALALSVLKPLATSLTLGAGGSGGIFAPSLFTGAMLGDAVGRIANSVFPSWTAPAAAYGLVAMAALFSAAAEAPITAIVIVFEMSGDYTIIPPLMIATVISTVLGRRFLNSTVYELKLEWLERAHCALRLPAASGVYTSLWTEWRSLIGPQRELRLGGLVNGGAARWEDSPAADLSDCKSSLSSGVPVCVDKQPSVDILQTFVVAGGPTSNSARSRKPAAQRVDL